MSRQRVNFQSEVLYAGPSPSTGYHWISGASLYPNNRLNGPNNVATGLVNQLHRVQDASYGFTLSKKDLNELGQAAYIDRIALDSPVINLQFSYIQANFNNEKSLGFTICSGTPVSAVSGFLTQTSDERNYFAKVSTEGSDGNSNTSNSYVIYGFGNCSISSYTASAAVGDFLKASVSVQGLNMLIQSTTGGSLPAVSPTDGTPILNNQTFILPYATGDAGLGPLGYSTLLPGDINFYLSYNDLGVDTTDWKVQNYSLAVNLNRTEIKKLGSKYAVSRQLQLPLNATLSVNAIVGETVTGNLADLLKCGANGYTARITVNKPACDAGVITVDTGVAVQYELRNASLDSESFSISVGGDKSVTLSFTSPVSGPQDTANGLFLSGIC